jgi:small ligand-binding sensory domain FIST
MKWASTLSRRPGAADAFTEAAEALERQLAGHPPDLLLAFVSPDHAAGCPEISLLASRRFPGALLIGCTGGGVIGDAREAEDGPALSLTAAALPRVRISGFHVEMSSLPADQDDVVAWRSLCGVQPEERPKLMLLADPFTMDSQALLAGLDRAYLGAPKFGGLASGGRHAGANRLFLGGEVHRSGAVGVAFSGQVSVETVIAQGCRPIGKPMLVTRCRGGLLQQLDQGTPIQALTELYRSLSERDRELVHSSLFLAIDMREERIEYDPSEFLVRNILGADEESGALAIGAELRPMQVVQFALRDARTAEEDLQRMLERNRQATPGGRPAGALLFSCLGRGAGLFGRPDHDTDLFQEKLGPAPLGGFFCNGEIGPVGGTTFLHGYTSAFAIFREFPAV